MCKSDKILSLFLKYYGIQMTFEFHFLITVPEEKWLSFDFILSLLKEVGHI